MIINSEKLAWDILAQLGIDRRECELVLGQEVGRSGVHPLDMMRHIRRMPAYMAAIERECFQIALNKLRDVLSKQIKVTKQSVEITK